MVNVSWIFTWRLRQYHHVCVVQQIRPQRLSRCNNCHNTGHIHIASGRLHDFRHIRSFGTCNGHRWHRFGNQGWTGIGVHLISGCNCTIWFLASGVHHNALPIASNPTFWEKNLINSICRCSRFCSFSCCSYLVLAAILRCVHAS